jgi:restriction system protein
LCELAERFAACSLANPIEQGQRMARRGRKTNGEEAIGLVALLPWWLGLVLAVVSYFFFHALAKPPAIAVARVDQVGTAVIGGLIAAAALALQYVAPIVCVAGAMASAVKRHERSSLIHRVTSSSAAGALDGMAWQEFELLVGEAFRLQGFAVEERGGASADGGVDLVLRRDGRRYFVQCKQWKVLQIGVQVVRELYGVVAAHGAGGGYVVTSGKFTAPAADFARSVGLQLIDGPALEAMIRRAQQARRAGVESRERVSPPAPVAPRAPAPAAVVQALFCPKCGSAMQTKLARRGPNAGRHFWSCQRYPECDGTRPA